MKTIQAHEEKLLAEGKMVQEARVKGEVVAWRGVMTKVSFALLGHLFELICFDIVVSQDVLTGSDHDSSL